MIEMKNFAVHCCTLSSIILTLLLFTLKPLQAQYANYHNETICKHQHTLRHIYNQYVSLDDYKFGNQCVIHEWHQVTLKAYVNYEKIPRCLFNSTVTFFGERMDFGNVPNHTWFCFRDRTYHWYVNHQMAAPPEFHIRGNGTWVVEFECKVPAPQLHDYRPFVYFGPALAVTRRLRNFDMLEMDLCKENPLLANGNNRRPSKSLGRQLTCFKVWAALMATISCHVIRFAE